MLATLDGAEIDAKRNDIRIANGMGPSERSDPKLTFSTTDAPTPPGRHVAFYELPRVVQERFVAATRSSLFHTPSPMRLMLVEGALAAALFGVALGLLWLGIGDSSSAFTILGFKPALTIAICFMLAAALLGALLSMYTSRTSLPYRAGTYVLHIGLAEAHSPEIVVYPWSLVTKIERRGRGLFFTIADGRVVTVKAGADDFAEKLEDVVLRTRAEVSQLFAAHPERTAARFDPFHVGTVSSPLGPQDAIRPAPPFAGVREYGVTLLSALAIALLLVTARNFASDRAMWAAAKKAGTASAWRAYLAAGGLSWQAAADEELPRAELHEVQLSHDLDATLAFAKTHKQPAIQAELSQVVRRTMLFSLEQAKQAGTVTSLDAFAQRYPTGPVQGELDIARHDVFTKALERYRPIASSAAVYTAVEQMVRYAEKHGPAVDVRPLAVASESLASADAKLRKSKLFQGEASLPGRYLASEAQLARANDAVVRVAGELGAAFPSDVLTVRAGDPIRPDAVVTVPTVYVRYSVEWARFEFASTTPKGIYVGIDVPLVVATRIPGGAAEDDVLVRKTIRRSPEAWRFARDKVTGPGAREEKAYDQMLDRAFGQMTNDAQGAFVKRAKA